MDKGGLRVKHLHTSSGFFPQDQIEGFRIKNAFQEETKLKAPTNLQ